MTSVEKEFLFLKKIKYFVLYLVFFTFVLYLGILVKYYKKHPFFSFSCADKFEHDHAQRP